VVNIQAAVFGVDNRKDLNLYPREHIRKLGPAVAAMVDLSKLDLVGEFYVISGKTLMDKQVLCPSEIFKEQLVLSECTAFLISPDKVMTAGHCLINFTMKNLDWDPEKDARWVFNYTEGRKSIHKSDVYKGKIIHLDYGNLQPIDYAIIQLERPVVGVEPFKLRKDGGPSLYEEVLMLGHPSGLPLKVTDKGRVISIEDEIFTVDLDGFKGNSGSPVLNPNTGVVEGIYVRGNPDDYAFDWDLDDPCTKPISCTTSTCRLGDVVRINKIDI